MQSDVNMAEHNMFSIKTKTKSQTSRAFVILSPLRKLYANWPMVFNADWSNEVYSKYSQFVDFRRATLDFRWTSEHFRFSNFTFLQWRQREANFGLDEFKD